MPTGPRNVFGSWHRTQAGRGQSQWPFHRARSTAVSVMLAEGVPVKVVWKVLWHSLLTTTAYTYGHLFPEAFEQAADAMERTLAG